MVSSIMKMLRSLGWVHPCSAIKRHSPDSEQMKYEVISDNKKASVESHALRNAVAHLQGSSAGMRKSADAVAELARQFQEMANGRSSPS